MAWVGNTEGALAAAVTALYELFPPEVAASAYFGCTPGSPPGVPGGGMTGVVPGFGSGGLAWGIGAVTSAGGRITPPVRSNRSLKLSPGRVSERVERGSWGPDLAPLSSSVLGTEAVEASPIISAIATATMRNVGRSQTARRTRESIVAGLHVAVAMSSSPSKVNLRAGTWFCRGTR